MVIDEIVGIYYTDNPVGAQYTDCMMAKKSIINRVSGRECGEENSFAPVSRHKWLLISASLMLFLVLPLLFIWGSLDAIHPHSYESSNATDSDDDLSLEHKDVAS